MIKKEIRIKCKIKIKITKIGIVFYRIILYNNLSQKIKTNITYGGIIVVESKNENINSR